MGHNEHTTLISKVLYGLKTSGARWHEKFSETLHQLGFSPSKADHDVQMEDEGDHYFCIYVYSYSLIYSGKKLNEF